MDINPSLERTFGLLNKEILLSDIEKKIVKVPAIPINHLNKFLYNCPTLKVFAFKMQVPELYT